MARLVVERATDGAPLWTVGVCASWWTRLHGLMGRRSLDPGEGLYFPGTNSIHMLFMRFAIDCVFVGDERSDGTRLVTAVKPNLRPWTGVVWWVGGARGALEVPAGSIARTGLRVGDMLRLLPAHGSQTVPSAA